MATGTKGTNGTSRTSGSNGTSGSKTEAAEGIFAVEVEPGVFVYSLPPSHTLPASTRKMIDEMDARAAERIDRRWAEVRQFLESRRNGHAPT